MNVFAEGGKVKIGGVCYGLLIFDGSQVLGSGGYRDECFGATRVVRGESR
jgi:hypothetical protein